MRHVFPGHEVFHRFANQDSNTSGRSSCGSQSFSGGVAFSYGTAIAQKHVELGVTFVNQTDYSNSTSRHKSYLARAIHGDTIGIFRHISMGERSLFRKDFKVDNQEEVEAELNLMAKLTATQKRARKYDYTGRIEGLKANLARFCKVAGLRCPDMDNIDATLAKINAKRERALRAEARAQAIRQAEHEKQAKAALVLWLAGDITAEVRSLVYRLPTDHVRLVNDGLTVNTTRNVSVPVTSIRRLIPLLRAITMGKIAPDRLTGHHIDGYTIGVIDVAGDTMAIGCHNFKISDLLTELASVQQ